MPRTRAQRSEYIRYRLKLIEERKTLAVVGISPYETAVRRIEKRTGGARSTWEHKLNDPKVYEANKIARQIAGIHDLPMRKAALPRGNASISRNRAA